VCYAPAGAEHVCFEPVSHVTNAHNLLDAFDLDTGLRMLAPNESMSGEIRMTWRSDRRRTALPDVANR
jgi:aldose 1-epimerase